MIFQEDVARKKARRGASRHSRFKRLFRVDVVFTGLVQARGTVVESIPIDLGCRLRIRADELFRDESIGASVAVNGCCLTIVELSEGVATFDAVPETMSRTNLGACSVGSDVNLERSLRATDELGGHFVTGHIDRVIALQQRDDQSAWSTFWFELPPELAGQIVPKGSVALDGVSLTVAETSVRMFSIALIPHTLAVTTLGEMRPGARVNLETDLLAKYIQRQFDLRFPSTVR